MYNNNARDISGDICLSLIFKKCFYYLLKAHKCNLNLSKNR